MKKEKLDFETVDGCQLSVVNCRLQKYQVGKPEVFKRYEVFPFWRGLGVGMFILLFSLLLTPMFAQIEKSKTIEKTFDLGSTGIVKVGHRYGLLKVTKSKDGKVHLNTRMRVEGNSEESIQKALDQFEIDINEFGDQVSIDTDLGIKNWHGRNGKITLTFNNGTKVKGLKKLTAEMLLEVPNLKELALKNKYEDIIVDHNLEGDLDVNIYDGDLKVKNVKGEVTLNVKYGKATFENIQNADLTLYDSKMELESAKDLKVSSKYSEYTIGDTESLIIRAYDDKMELGNIKGKFEMTDKYSEVEMGNFGEAVLDIYDADFVGKKGGKLTIDGSKYSKYRFVEVGDFDIDESYDDEFIIRSASDFSIHRTKYSEFNIDQITKNLSVRYSHDDKFIIEGLESLEVGETKYTEYEIGNLSGKVSLADSHDDKVTVREVADSFKGLHLDGKYTKVYMDIPSTVKYVLDASMKYGSLEYPESAFESNYYKEKDSMLEVKGRIKGAGSDAPKVEVRGHDCKVDLN